MASGRDLALCSCRSSLDNVSKYPAMEKFLPNDYKYTVCNWKKVAAEHFECRFRVNVGTITEVGLWFQKFLLSSSADFKEISLPECKEAYIVAMRCDHTTTNPPRRYKNVDFLVRKQHLCPTRLVIILKHPEFSEKYGIHDVHCDEFPTTVVFHHQHNHLLESYDEFYNSSLMLFPDMTCALMNSVSDAESWLCEAPVETRKPRGIKRTSDDIVKQCDGKNETYYTVLESVFPHTCNEEGDQSDAFLLPLENTPFEYVPDGGSYTRYVADSLTKDRDPKYASEESDYKTLVSSWERDNIDPAWPPFVCKLPEVLEEVTE